jgi:hypothetical protein
VVWLHGLGDASRIWGQRLAAAHPKFAALLLEEGYIPSASGSEEDGGGTFATCRFVQPLAPRLAVTALGGVEQHAWFDLLSLPVTNGLVALAAGAMAVVYAAVADDDDARADNGASVASTASAASDQACAAQLQRRERCLDRLRSI